MTNDNRVNEIIDILSKVIMKHITESGQVENELISEEIKVA